ncbi:MAG: cupin [Spirulina sp. SIO3F2]|nr:cupin [Spirulina sp. SIO3F2]
MGKTWIVTDVGTCEPLNAEIDLAALPNPYRLYHFLSDLDAILLAESDDRRRLEQICPRVRHLLDEAPWLTLQYNQPHAKRGWSVTKLYEEPGYPLTIQMVAWAGGEKSTIHNHATWGVVALCDGQEENTFWQRTGDDAKHPDAIATIGDCTLEPGDIISFLPAAIHRVEALGETPTISFNLYGITDYPSRFKFDHEAKTAQKF